MRRGIRPKPVEFELPLLMETPCLVRTIKLKLQKKHLGTEILLN